MNYESYERDAVEDIKKGVREYIKMTGYDPSQLNDVMATVAKHIMGSKVDDNLKPILIGICQMATYEVQDEYNRGVMV